MVPTPSANRGLTLTEFDRDVRTVIDTVWADVVFVSSNYARKHAELIAAAASLGYITTQVHAGGFGRQWRVTRAGLTQLDNCTE